MKLQASIKQKSLLTVRALVQSCSCGTPGTPSLVTHSFPAFPTALALKQHSQLIPAPFHHSASTLPNHRPRAQPSPWICTTQILIFPCKQLEDTKSDRCNTQHLAWQAESSLMGGCCFQPKCFLSSLKRPTLEKENISEVYNYTKINP